MQKFKLFDLIKAFIRTKYKKPVEGILNTESIGYNNALADIENALIKIQRGF